MRDERERERMRRATAATTSCRRGSTAGGVEPVRPILGFVEREIDKLQSHQARQEAFIEVCVQRKLSSCYPNPFQVYSREYCTL